MRVEIIFIMGSKYGPLILNTLPIRSNDLLYVHLGHINSTTNLYFMRNLALLNSWHVIKGFYSKPFTAENADGL